MQKLFNLVGALGFLLSAGTLAGIAVAYSKLPSIIDGYMDGIMDDVGSKVTEQLPLQVDQAMPPMPETTGLPVPVKSPL